MSPIQKAFAEGGSQRVAAEVARKLILRASSEASPYSEPRGATSTLRRPTTPAAHVSRMFNTGNLFFWRPKRVSGKDNRPLWCWNSLAIQLAYPGLQQRRLNDKLAKPIMKHLKDLQTTWGKAGVSNLASVQKNSDTFTVTVPFAYIPIHGVPTVAQAFASRVGMETDDPMAYVQMPEMSDALPSPTVPSYQPPAPAVPVSLDGEPAAEEPAVEEEPAIKFRWVRPETLKNVGGCFPLKSLNMLQSLPGAMLGTVSYGGGVVFLLRLEFTKEECEYLTMSSWMEIRPLDMFGLVRAWANTRMASDPPRFSQSLPSIAATIPKDARPRTSPEEILVDERNDYFWIPSSANGINDYESSMSRELAQPNGVFSVVDHGTGLTLRPPSSRLVLVDWANLKMAYSDNSGNLDVKSLDRTRPASSTHYRRFLEKKAAHEYAVDFITRTFNMGHSVGVLEARPYVALEKDTGVANLLMDIVNRYDDGEGEGETQLDDLNLMDIYKCQAAIEWCQVFMTCCNRLVALSADEDNRILLFKEYSVLNALSVLAGCRIMDTKAGQFTTLVAEDNEVRKKYKEQDQLDPDYVPQAVPFMSKDKDGNPRGMMPHQKRVSSRLATNAEFVILPVHAGGGKTMICVYDVLKELGNKTARRFLIMCPSHLVGQYVKEFVYFTDGRINVLAVSKYTLNRHGIDGMARMLEAAPLNTVVVADYNLAKGNRNGMFETGYGTSVAQVFPVVEMLRSFNFDYVFLDESHYLKGNNQRTSAVSRLITEIPKKRLASGTMTPNDITDLVQQVALLDPTIFGSRQEFVERYAQETRGGKVTKWKTGAKVEIMARLKESVVWAPAKRKEWAAILPELLEDAVAVDLTPAQQSVYNNLLNQIVEELQKQLAESKEAKFKNLKKFFDTNGAERPPTEEEEAETDDEADPAEEMEDAAFNSALEPYLQRLEMFVTAPAMDVLGDQLLNGADRISPKVHAVAKICREHIEAGTPGKILVFCNYKNSAQALYEGLPDDLKAQAIYYTAAQKAECAAEFETNPKKLIMIGIESSMNTGLNLQFCSRLIRTDSVWTPGALEQGNSRIGRPNMKVKETRKKIYINWITADRTVDVTKMAYLFAKRISVGLFEEAGNPLYANVAEPPIFKINLKTIAESNEQTSSMLRPYYAAYGSFKNAQFQDFKQYKLEHPEDLNEDGSVKMTPLSRASNPAGSGLMYRVPYVPGVELYGSDDLGLVRYDQLFSQNSELLENAEDEDDVVEDKAQKQLNQEEYAKVSHLSVHCEFGDCEIMGLNKSALRVRDAQGQRHVINKLTAFVITRAQTSHKDMRTLLLQQVGDIPFKAPKPDVKANEKVKLPKKGQKAPEVVDTALRVTLGIVLVNDFVGIEMNDVSSNPAGARALEAIGFKTPAAYAYAEMPTALHMYNQFKKWAEKGFYFHKEYNEACKTLYAVMKTARKNAVNLTGMATTAQLTNFFRLQIKPVANPLMLCPYPMIKNHKVYLCLPLTGHPASQKAMSVRAPGVAWAKADVGETLSVFMPSLQKLDSNMKALINSGIVINNYDELVTRRTNIQRRNPSLLKGLQS